MARHILIPMDASPASQHALEFVLREFEDVSITVLHVKNPLEDAYFTSEEEFYTRVDVLEDQARERAEAIFANANELAEEHGVPIDTATALGPPAAAIVEFSEDANIDHIVIGSHGRSGVARLLLGSVAEKVARRSPVPVTVVK